jgi:hypothetical protein
MVTNNFKQAMKLILTNNNNRNSGGLPITDVSGNAKYLLRLSGWPNSSNVDTGVRINSYNNPGIWVGSGLTPPTPADYCLESRITSGMSGAVQIDNTYLDANGNPQLKMIVTLTNTGSTSITVGEIGFFQNVQMANNASGSGSSSNLVMIDRTVLNTPVTIPAGESAAITYTLKTVIA